MNPEKFDPSNPEYKKVEDLPEEHRAEFVDIPKEEGEGFVRKSVHGSNSSILEKQSEALRMNNRIDEYEENIEVLKGNFETPKWVSVKGPESSGKTDLKEVAQHLRGSYGVDAIRCDIPDNLDKLPEELKDGNKHHFLGSRGSFGNMDYIKYVQWIGGKWKIDSSAEILPYYDDFRFVIEQDKIKIPEFRSPH